MSKTIWKNRDENIEAYLRKNTAEK